MEAAVVDKIVSLAEPHYHKEYVGEDELFWADKRMTLIEPPQPGFFAVQTLNGLVDLLRNGVEGFEPANYVAHVQDETTVAVSGRRSDGYGRRQLLVKASALVGISKFVFNQYHVQESFLIGLASHFQPTEDLTYLLQTASVMDMKESVRLSDNGINQDVVAAKGIAFKETITLRNRASLAPYRTFREVAQPVSEFLFRAKDGGQLALYEADGGSWKIAAIQAVAEWLVNRLRAEALGDLPVVS